MADSWFALSRMPEGGPLEVLEKDYAAMLDDGLLSNNQPSFREIISVYIELQSRINK